MVFRYTENPLKTPIFPPAEPPVSAVASRYTENSSFPYTGVKDDLRHFAGFSLACLARIALARSSINLPHFAGFSLACFARIALARASGFADTVAAAQYRGGASFIGATVRPRRRR